MTPRRRPLSIAIAGCGIAGMAAALFLSRAGHRVELFERFETPHPIGAGRKYRATVIGPGVTPDVMWEGPAPTGYDAAADAEANAHQRSVLGPDPRCVVN